MTVKLPVIATVVFVVVLVAYAVVDLEQIVGGPS